MKAIAVLSAATLAWMMVSCSADRSAEPVPETATKSTLKAPLTAVEASPQTQAPAPVRDSVVIPAKADAPAAGAAASEPPRADDAPGSASADPAADPQPQAAQPAPAAAPASNAAELPVRDAREATEEAARKILDATVGAASKIRDVGASAVQSVRDSISPRSEEPATVREGATPDDAAGKDPDGMDQGAPAVEAEAQNESAK